MDLHICIYIYIYIYIAGWHLDCLVPPLLPVVVPLPSWSRPLLSYAQPSPPPPSPPESALNTAATRDGEEFHSRGDGGRHKCRLDPKKKMD